MLDSCEPLDLGSIEEQHERLKMANVGELEAPRTAIKQTGGWPIAGSVVALAGGEGRLSR